MAAASAHCEQEEMTVEWIEQVTGESKKGLLSIAAWLKSGQVLCRLVNKIKPRLVSVSRMLTPRHKMENIRKFLETARTFGIPEKSMFSPSDLYEEKDLGKVIACISAFGEAAPRVVAEYQGPKLASLGFRGAAKPLLDVVGSGPGEPAAEPQNFASYYRSNLLWEDTAALSGIYKMFSKAKPSVCSGIEEVSADASTEAGSVSDSSDMEAVPSTGRHLLPSMGGFHGAGGLYGGVVLRRQ